MSERLLGRPGRPRDVNSFELDVFKLDEEDDLCGWQLRISVDGVDLTAAGCGMDPDELLPDGLLTATGSEPRTLIRCGFSSAGCGSAVARIRFDDNTVVWHDWDSSLGDLPTFEFDRVAYVAEVQRADREREWEPPTRTTG